MVRRYRAIITADLHISNRLPYAKIQNDGVTDRLMHSLGVLEEISLHATKCEANSVIILGDIFDRSLVDAVTLTYTTRALVNMSVPVYLLSGNHDANNISGGRYVVEAFGEMNKDGIIYMDGTVISPNKWLNFYPVPFSLVSDTKNKIRMLKKTLDKNNVNVLFFHNSVLGCNHAEWTCDDGLEPKLLTSGFNYAFGGHFHEHQKFGKRENGMYVGSPMHHNFGDSGRDAGYWVVDFYENGKIKMEFIESSAPKFHTTKKNVKSKNWNSGDYVRVVVEATHPDWIKQQPAVTSFCDGLRGKGMHVVVVHKPIHQHAKRMASLTSGVAKLTIERSIVDYTRTDGVNLGALEPKRLRRVGLEILQSVRGENGVV